jgi:phosphopantothenoylcysteine synthetase/decarboxylase
MDLHNQMKVWVLNNPNGIIIHSAAVGDYAPKEQGGKITSGQDSLSIILYPTVKILDQIKKWSPDCLIVSFKAAAPDTSPRELTEVAQKQRIRSQSAMVFANVLTQTGQDVQLVSDTTVQRFTDRHDGIEALISWIKKHRPITNAP